jgi:muramoyltetrapeptide carboxypeptidase
MGGFGRDIPSDMLVPGSRIAVVAPGHPFQPPRLEQGLAKLASWGFELVRMPHLDAHYRYTAGTRAERRADLLAALTDPSIDAVWYARGGSGTVHLVSDLPLDTLDHRPVFGFSDATTLLSQLWNHRAGRPIHGPVLHTLGSTSCSATDAATHQFLLHGPTERHWAGTLVDGPSDAVRGPVVGGNLCVLASLCGTALQLEARGCILLLEEIGEPAYKVDRTLTQLRLSGMLDGVVGIALGEFSGARIPEGADWAIEDVVAECVHGLGIPVVTGMPVGHGATNHPFQVGEVGVLDASGLLLAEGRCPTA